MKALKISDISGVRYGSVSDLLGASALLNLLLRASRGTPKIGKKSGKSVESPSFKGFRKGLLHDCGAEVSGVQFLVYGIGFRFEVHECPADTKFHFQSKRCAKRSRLIRNPSP